MEFSSTSATATLGQTFTPPTLTTTPSDLDVTYSSSDPAVATVDEATGAVTLVAEGTTTITATFAGDDQYNEAEASYTLIVSKAVTPVVDGDRYELVTDASTLAAGDKIIIVNEDALKALSTNQKTYNRAATTFAFNDDKTITPGEKVAVIKLGGESGKWTLYVTNGETTGYLYAASNSSNYLQTEATVVDANAQAAISIAQSSGNATIEFQGDNSHNQLLYNKSSSSNLLFSCYTSTSSNLVRPQIYRQIKQAVETVDINRDGEQTIADVTALVNILLGKATEANDFDKYDFQAADVDGDGSRTVADLTELVKRLLGKQ